MDALTPSPCPVCGALVVKPHPRSECAWVLRDRLEAKERELAEVRAALVVAQAMAGQR